MTRPVKVWPEAPAPDYVRSQRFVPTQHQLENAARQFPNYYDVRAARDLRDRVIRRKNAERRFNLIAWTAVIILNALIWGGFILSLVAPDMLARVL